MSQYQLCGKYHVNNVARSFVSVDSEEMHVLMSREDLLSDAAHISQLGKLLPPDSIL